MNTNITNSSQNKMFFENIKKMTDEQLLVSVKNKADYNPTFIEMAREEIALRGYDLSISNLENIDKLLIEHKTTDELVSIYVNASDYKKEFEELSIDELKNRNYDISTLLVKNETEKMIIKEGVEGSHIFLGYVLAVFGGIIGLIVALNYMNKKLQMANGEKLYKYNQNTRKKGRNMLVVWAISNLIGAILLFS